MTETTDRLAEVLATQANLSKLAQYLSSEAEDEAFGVVAFASSLLQSLSTDLDKAQQEVARLHTLAKANNDLARHEANGRRALQEEIERLREALGGLCDSLDALIDHSEGVTGLHLNGDVAPWTSLLDGGAFEPWLMALSDARTALNPQPGKESGND